MYIAGYFGDLENRLHQQGVTTADFVSYAAEACSYYANVVAIGASYLVQKWNAEFIKKGYATTAIITSSCGLGGP